jgi:hypothetical protein
MARVRKPTLVAALLVSFGLALGATGALAAANVYTAHAQKTVKVVFANDQLGESAGVWTDVPGMSIAMTVPSGEKDLFLADFSAMTGCVGSNGAEPCEVRVLMNGAEVAPGFTVFDSAVPGLVWQSHDMQFIASPIGPGGYTFKVQFKSLYDNDFWMQTRTFSLTRSII